MEKQRISGFVFVLNMWRLQKTLYNAKQNMHTKHGPHCRYSTVQNIRSMIGTCCMRSKSRRVTQSIKYNATETDSVLFMNFAQFM